MTNKEKKQQAKQIVQKYLMYTEKLKVLNLLIEAAVFEDDVTKLSQLKKEIQTFVEFVDTVLENLGKSHQESKEMFVSYYFESDSLPMISSRYGNMDVAEISRRISKCRDFFLTIFNPIYDIYFSKHLSQLEANLSLTS